MVADRVRDDEVAVGEALHQGTRPEAVGSVVREVRLTEDIQTGQVALQVVVHPQAAHRVMDRRVDSHRDFVRVFSGDLLVHVKEVAVLASHDIFAITFDGCCEIEIHRQTGRPDAVAGITAFLCRAGRDVARSEVTIRGVTPFEIVVSFALGNLIG